MGKISLVSAKYIIHADIQIDGVVDKPDVIGAVFGQTEGLLGAELELRELQKSGRIGRIEVLTEIKNGKTIGTIIIPSSLDKAETAIIAASLEIIQRIGPCNAKVTVQNIEDVRISKRKFVIERAKQLLKQLMETVMPDSQELSDEVAYSVRMMEIQEYGRERLPAGPAVDESDEVIVVEGRADVLNLLKHGIKNVIAMNGTNVPQTIIDLSKEKTIIAFVDGDRGGDLILKELFNVAEIDFVAKAPDGKEVEEITKKEIHKALRAKITGEQYILELKGEISRQENGRAERNEARFQNIRKPSVDLSEQEKKVFSELLENLIGTRAACILDNNLKILGKVPISELEATLKNIQGGVYAVVIDGTVDRNIAKVADNSRINFLVGTEAKIKPTETRVNVITLSQLS
ncbi:MAG: DNA primase DnaG [Candidatus Woesearchaeota archaeon]